MIQWDSFSLIQNRTWLMLRKFQSDLQKINQNNQKSDIGQVSIEKEIPIRFKEINENNQKSRIKGKSVWGQKRNIRYSEKKSYQV